MIASLIEKIETALAPSQDPAATHDEHLLQLSAAVLMIEVMRADHHMAPEEEKRLVHLIQRHFGLDEQETSDLIELAHGEAEKSVSLHRFTRQLTDGLEVPERAHVVELLWELAYADGRIDMHEEHLIRQIADWLYLPHNIFIRAKHRAAKKQ